MQERTFLLVAVLVFVYILGDVLNDNIIESARKTFGYDTDQAQEIPLSMRVLLHKYSIWIVLLGLVVLYNYNSKGLGSDFKKMPSSYKWSLIGSTVLMFIGSVLYLQILSVTDSDTFLTVRTSGHLLASFFVAVFVLHTKTLSTKSMLGVVLVTLGIPMVVKGSGD